MQGARAVWGRGWKAELMEQLCTDEVSSCCAQLQSRSSVAGKLAVLATTTASLLSHPPSSMMICPLLQQGLLYAEAGAPEFRGTEGEQKTVILKIPIPIPSQLLLDCTPTSVMTARCVLLQWSVTNLHNKQTSISHCKVAVSDWTIVDDIWLHNFYII